jgi:hypothetical protein
MPLLQATHGRIVDLRRHTNVHLYWRGRYGPAERYELWLRDPAGCEHQFTIHTRILPARHGHEVSLLTEALTVRAIVNWSTGMRVNYLRIDPPPLLRLRDLWVPPALLIALASWLGDVDLLILPPAALAYLLAAVMVRYVIRHRHAAVIQRALREVQRPGGGHRDVARRNGREFEQGRIDPVALGRQDHAGKSRMAAADRNGCHARATMSFQRRPESR